MKSASLIIVLSYALSFTVGLNIILTTTDNWVSKNVRMLYTHLKHHDHNVILVGPLYQEHEDDTTNRTIEDGGEFGHLLDVHQIYFKNLKKVNKRRVRNVKSKSEIEQEEPFTPVSTNYYGQDPLDKNVWYVNSNSNTTLQFTLNNIIPEYYPSFNADLVIIGPNEGLESQAEIKELVSLSVNSTFKTLAVSTQDNHGIYYQDEKYFNIHPSSHDHLSKHNVFTRNIHYLNRKVDQLIKKMSTTKEVFGLNVVIPSINHDDSHCMIAKHHDMSYEQMKPTAVQKEAEITVQDHFKEQQQKFNLEARSEHDVQEIEERSTFVDEYSNYYKHVLKHYRELEQELAKEALQKRTLGPLEQVLRSCHVAVNVIGNENVDLREVLTS
ncbi:uncharacterized protein SPAPADRAFT_155831 [Spathaspora passalidarum NRRL Y-27907]|uniref:Uncharacterized protein n=1 Tax=Spathaspora passalidarum (strain NRRL Y-27907 / 11-Y1) TaxID=619300 RepID=G3ASL4_SPAPN|nr:uncharacterized protein SPAPADRAFT_155831 [Spathaspora passalidarum NRRL Y-27907]EGW30700.1 hypothetical protein SPAPADRAFT_155831 [Spathaspora passalidarum NRRL Y-27907]